MTSLVWIISLVILCSQTLAQSPKASLLTYRGAVVEYHPISGNGKSDEAVASENAENYVKFIQRANQYNVDIIVFPEDALTSKLLNRNSDAASYVPDPEQKKAICDDTTKKYGQYLKKISCAAKSYKTYVVVNHFEKEDCPVKNCSADGFLLYNTNTVFDRNGAIIARYRKYNLFVEPMMNVTEQPILSTFTTDFNVTFGQFVCFDISYESPALKLVQDKKITDFVVPNRWFSESPFYVGIETQAAWAYATDTNVLSSGYNAPELGNAGSGIFAGIHGEIISYLPNKTSNVMIVADVPKLINGKRLHPIDRSTTQQIEMSDTLTPNVATWNVQWADDFKPYKSMLLNPKTTNYSQKLCNNDVCCHFDIRMSYRDDIAKTSGASYYSYRVAVFNGVRLFGNGSHKAGIEVCALVACTNDTIESCGKTFGTNISVVEPVTFDRINISRSTTNSENVFFVPVTLNRKNTPLPVVEFRFSRDDANKTVTLFTDDRQINIQAFAIYGRNFKKDEKNGASIVSSVSSYALAIVAFVTLRQFGVV